MNAIVTTTINPPTEALLKYADKKNFRLVIAGDQKTPHEEYRRHHGSKWVYLSPEFQEAFDKKLSDAIGWNCIQRRNFAFLYAAKELKAELVATIDDDNIPHQDWGENILVGARCAMSWWATEQPCFDPISVTNHPQIWHRGFPLELVPDRQKALKHIPNSAIIPDVQADFWNGDPDIDAICRMTMRPDCQFQSWRFPFFSDRIAPFNSQNTFLARRVMPHYFMFPHVGRMDDIWAAYHVQAQGFKVCYHRASVTQKRNEHNAIADMKKEYLGYENNLAIVKALDLDKNAVLRTIPKESLMAFDLYQKHF